jgi:ABC-type branched-subunit amino acid transport system permease subunit
MGVNATRAKLIAFATGALSLGWAAVCTPTTPCSSSTTTDFKRGVDIAMYMVLGGMDVFYGPLLGAFIITYLSTALQFLPTGVGKSGASSILVMIFRPQGILGRDTLNVRRWFGAREATAA